MGFAEAGITLKRVESEEFQQALERMMENPDLVTLLRPLMAYNMGSGHKTRWIESTNDYTHRCSIALVSSGLRLQPTTSIALLTPLWGLIILQYEQSKLYVFTFAAIVCHAGDGRR